ncbi:transcription initiation factor TFIID subunit 4-like isoform X1 [Tachysurus ichikawai]
MGLPLMPLCQFVMCAGPRESLRPPSRQARSFGVNEVMADVVSLVSHATEVRLRSTLENVSVLARHRTEASKDEEHHEQTSDVRAQLKFFEQLERLEKQRKDDEEREILLKVAKSRSRQEDPEQARLKQKAKEMQQQELAQMRQRDANLTALAAIGPRKKRKLDSPGAPENYNLNPKLDKNSLYYSSECDFSKGVSTGLEGCSSGRSEGASQTFHLHSYVPEALCVLERQLPCQVASCAMKAPLFFYCSFLKKEKKNTNSLEQQFFGNADYSVIVGIRAGQ